MLPMPLVLCILDICSRIICPGEKAGLLHPADIQSKQLRSSKLSCIRILSPRLPFLQCIPNLVKVIISSEKCVERPAINIMNTSFADVIIWTLPESPSTTIFPVFSEEADNLFLLRNFCPGLPLQTQDLLKLLRPQDPLPPWRDSPQASGPCEEREEYLKGGFLLLLLFSQGWLCRWPLGTLQHPAGA